ncbi:MAG: polysaccharide deacetylase family protein [Bacteroidetes bacterium]|nr:polysaccharide deacetylase family protein [Bacteroidota bacterium]
MLTFKKTLFSFAIALLLLLVADYYLDLTIVFYLLLLMAFLSVVFYGSYFIDSNFHIKVLCNAPTAHNEVALTFDDGPIANNTERILDILKLNHVPATFFCIGHRINSNEQLFKRIVSEGHTIGNHSYSHHFFSISFQQIEWNRN